MKFKETKKDEKETVLRDKEREKLSWKGGERKIKKKKSEKEGERQRKFRTQEKEEEKWERSRKRKKRKKNWKMSSFFSEEQFFFRQRWIGSDNQDFDFEVRKVKTKRNWKILGVIFFWLKKKIGSFVFPTKLFDWIFDPMILTLAQDRIRLNAAHRGLMRASLVINCDTLKQHF